MASITIKQIAAEAGVSIGTVDRVLHNRGRVSEQNKARILDICRRYNYAQNIVGKAMAMQRKHRKIAVVINAESQNSFSAQIYTGVRAIEEEVKDYNISFEYYDLCKNTVEEQVGILTRLEQQELAGIIIKPVDNPLVRMHLEILAEKGIPVVLCTSDMDIPGKLCFVGQDHYRDGRLMANVLCKIHDGPLNILMLVAPLQTHARKARIDGFLSYMREHKKPFHVCEICEITQSGQNACAKIISALKAYPEAQALYINTTEIEPCIQALDSYGQFQGLRFCFGHQKRVGPYIHQGKLDFAIGEFPFQHGYRAGEAIFKYLLSQEMPSPSNCVFHGNVLLEENCDF